MLPKQDGDTFNDCLSLEHILFNEVLKEWRKNVGSRKFPVYKSLCTYVSKYVRGKLRSNFDLHYVNPVLSDGGSSDVAFYVMKYMLKPSDRAQRLQQALRINLDDDEYEHIWKLVKPRHFESEALGLGRSVYSIGDNDRRVYSPDPRVYSELRKGIEVSKRFVEPIPSLASKDDGKFRPLARYYKNRPEIFTMDDYQDFFYGSKKSRADNVVIPDYDHVSQIVKKIDDFDKKVDDVDFQQSALELDDLFDSDSLDFIDF